ncbi:hypothetical protein BJ878DRAFT_73052 [Calycina marina]|uniref:Uncharacterized protein n=1 Tax=Calycina marina TaxID=1763456 RepID=A0A9P7Z2I7_9HELO|nr:hypothetical protein BJ878DRAFT_73052 [Calycina marina]
MLGYATNRSTGVDRPVSRPLTLLTVHDNLPRNLVFILRSPNHQAFNKSSPLLPKHTEQARSDLTNPDLHGLVRVAFCGIVFSHTIQEVLHSGSRVCIDLCSTVFAFTVFLACEEAADKVFRSLYFHWWMSALSKFVISTDSISRFSPTRRNEKSAYSQRNGCCSFTILLLQSERRWTLLLECFTYRHPKNLAICIHVDSAVWCVEDRTDDFGDFEFDSDI